MLLERKLKAVAAWAIARRKRMLTLGTRVQEVLSRVFSMNWNRACESTLFVVHRAWILEIVLVSAATTFFALLWWHSGIISTPISQYIQSIWAILRGLSR